MCVRLCDWGEGPYASDSTCHLGIETMQTLVFKEFWFSLLCDLVGICCFAPFSPDSRAYIFFGNHPIPISVHALHPTCHLCFLLSIVDIFQFCQDPQHLEGKEETQVFGGIREAYIFSSKLYLR